MKNVQKTSYSWKILRTTFLKISKTQKSPQNSQKWTILKKSISCKEASNKKSSVNKLLLEIKILRMTFLKISKSKKIPENHTKTKKSINSMSYKETQNKKIRKQSVVRIEN